MKTATRIAAAALLATFAAVPALAAPPEGRWIKECGKGTFCRILIARSGPLFMLHYMITDPDDQRASGSCEWTSRMTRVGKTGVLRATSGRTDFEARADGDRLVLTGRKPADCGNRPRTETFSKDAADEVGDY